MNTYDVRQGGNGLYVVGEKKKFNERMDEAVKEGSVKLGGLYADYYSGGKSGGAIIDEFKMSALYQLFPPLYVFMGADGTLDFSGGFATIAFVVAAIFFVLVFLSGWAWKKGA